MANYYLLLQPIVRCLDPEIAHRVAILALRLGLGSLFGSRSSDPALKMHLWGLDFPNPVGLAAGFDKNAEVPDAIHRLGFGFTEVGGVTPRPQFGNEKPRIFRLEVDKAVINRMGFNSDGVNKVRSRLESQNRHIKSGIVGVNLGVNKDSDDPIRDFGISARALEDFIDFFVINVSSPNTPGLRALQGGDQLQRIIRQVRNGTGQSGFQRPVLVKISPDLSTSELTELLQAAKSEKVDGLIVSNTTTERPLDLRDSARSEHGGLSGRPLFEPSTQLLSKVFRLTDGSIPLIGVGGIFSGQDAYRKIRSGASLVQLYSAMVFNGPSIIEQIKADLLACLRADGFSSIAEAVGADHAKL